MKMKTPYALLVLFVLIVSSCGKETIENTIEVESENAITVENEILTLVNDYRATKGNSSLEFSSVAYKYANEHSNYMISKGNINHDNFNQRASKLSSEVSVTLVSENVAKDYTTAKATLDGWLNSTDHRKAIEGDFTHTAVSVKKDAKGNYYFTQLFYKTDIE